MRKMKDSGIEWIGEIPESWDVSKLLYFLRCPICDGPHETPEVLNEGIPFISVDSLNESENIDFSVVKKFISEEQYCEYKKKANLEKGDVLFTKAATIGKTAIVGDEKFMVWSPIAIIKPNKDKLFNKYLYYVLNCKMLIDEIVLNGSYNTQINVGMREIESARIPITSFEEQSRIADYLDKKCAEIDAIIATKEKTNELLKERRQSIIYEAVTKGLDSNVPMKDSGIEWIGEIPEHWNSARLRSRFTFGKGLPITKAELRDSGIGVVSYGQIHSKYNIGTTIKPELIRYVDNEYLDTNASSLVNVGDFIFADTSEDLSGCGNCVYVDVNYPLFAGYHTMILRPIGNASSKYYSYLFATDAWRSQIRAQASGVKLFSITQKMLRDALVIEPSEEEKERIVLFLDEMCFATNTIIASNEATIEKLKEYRQSIIYEAVTGKVEI